MKQELIRINPRSRAELQKLTIGNICIAMMQLMRNHIGYNHRISKEALFRKLFKRSPNDNLEDWLRWEFTKKAMHMLRQRTKCFVGSAKDEGGYSYFVVETFDDAQYYIRILENNIKRMRAMQKRAMQAAGEKWSRLPDWKPKTMIR